MRERSRISKHCLTFYSYCYYTKKLYKCVNTDLNTTVPPAVGVFSVGEGRNKEGEEGEQNWKHKQRLRR